MTPELSVVLDRAWTLLGDAVADHASPWRTPIVATAGDGADGRVMVLRRVDRVAATLTFFTDRRAGKVAAIAAAPSIAVIAYDATERLQLRLRGSGTIVTDDARVESAWAAIGSQGRRAYRTADPPGSPALSVAAAARLGEGNGRADFALLVVTVVSVESLQLTDPVHRRALFRTTVDGWAGEWLVP